VLAFPVYWWSFPAGLKGWVDRVWSQGSAYTFTPERSHGLLRDRPVLLLCSAGSRASTYRRYGYDVAMRTQIDVGVLGYGGLTTMTSEFYYEVYEDAPHVTGTCSVRGRWARSGSVTPYRPQQPEVASPDQGIGGSSS